MIKSHAAPNSTEALRKEIDRLKVSLRQVSGDVSDVTQNAVEAVRAGAAAVKDQVGDQLDHVADQGKKSVEAVRTQVAGHPLTFVAAAFAVGALLGFTMRRRE